MELCIAITALKYLSRSAPSYLNDMFLALLNRYSNEADDNGYITGHLGSGPFTSLLISRANVFSSDKNKKTSKSSKSDPCHARTRGVSYMYFSYTISLSFRLP